MLELDIVDADGTERLLVFGRLDLGADPEDVAEVVRAARPLAALRSHSAVPERGDALRLRSAVDVRR